MAATSSTAFSRIGRRRWWSARRHPARTNGPPCDDTIRSDVDWLTQCLPCRFQQAFAQRRMGEDRAGDILKPCTHLDGKAERCGQLGNARAYALNAKQKVIVGPRH